MDWQIATQTHQGNVRSVNEDALLVIKEYPLLLVADGMGGHLAGEVASGAIVERLAGLKLAFDLDKARAQVQAELLACNAHILEFATRELAGVTVGSTVVAMLARDGRGVCLWVGDSRLYRLRGGQLEQISEDHSYVSNLVRAGLLDAAEARHHPSANLITRAVGVHQSLELAVTSFTVQGDDIFLLCSDGLYNEIDEPEISQLLAQADVYRSSVQLLNLCLSRAARDNVTFVIAQAQEQSADICGADDTMLVLPDD
jgi:serine/threonine-protein phosphatase Stp1